MVTKNEPIMIGGNSNENTALSNIEWRKAWSILLARKISPIRGARMKTNPKVYFELM